MAYPAAVIALIAVQRRVPVQAFAAALGLATLTGAGFVLLLWASYQTGRVVVSRRGTGAVIAVALVSLAVRLPGGHPGSLIASHLVFVALPLLAGRYVAQHERLVTALEAGNRRLRRERELLAERERLRERLRIARDMHDSLGHRLGLVSIQAAALEVAPLPPDQAAAPRPPRRCRGAAPAYAPGDRDLRHHDHGDRASRSRRAAVSDRALDVSSRNRATSSLSRPDCVAATADRS